MSRLLVFGLGPALAACNLEVVAGDTGGVLPPTGGACPDGVSVVLTDYVSTQIALGAPDGSPESPSFLSTASTATQGLAFPLSGDVALPAERPRSLRVVVIDRFGTNVISWADPVSARVTAQLPVATGFESNPQDYIELGPGRPDLAYVARAGHNQDPGREAFDAGDDVLVIDTRRPAIVGRIPMPVESGMPPRPGRFQRVGGRVVVTLGPESVDFRSAGESELVAIDPERDTIAFRQTVAKLKNCGRAELAPIAGVPGAPGAAGRPLEPGNVLALACSGNLDPDGEVEDVAQSGIALFDASAEPLSELARYGADSLAGGPIQNEIAFASERLLLFKTQTPLGGGADNRLLALDIDSGQVTELARARPGAGGAGQGITFGGLLCSPGCSELCLMADADRGVIARFRSTADGLRPDGAVVVETRVGLPPVLLTFR